MPGPGPDTDAGAAHIARVADAGAAACPGRAAVICDDQPVSYATLAASVRAAAAGLAGRGLAPGAVLALVARTEPDTVAVLLGAAYAGGSAALMNPLLTDEEAAALRGLVGATVSLRDPGELTDVLAAPPTTGAPQGGGEADALTLFTSGTTGLPKPVPMTHRALMARLRAYAPGFDPDQPAGTRLMAAPLFHIGGLLGLLLSVWSGHTTVMQRRFDAGEWLALVERYRVQSAFVVPAMLHRIVAHPDLARRDLSSLQALAYGAAAAPVDLVRRAMAALPGVGFANTFGQTETLGGYTALTPADHRDPDRIGSVGRPLPGVELRIVAPGTDTPVPEGEVGELLVRSEQNVRPGWLRTGDLARRDADGYLYPSGRLADTINRGGEKFGPVEIEGVLRRHPAVAEAAVAGMPDPEMGERVVALVVPAAGGAGHLDPDELRRHCRRHLAPFKVPERIVTVDELPYDQLGKVRRAAVAAVVAARG